jgi:hypothetical protein
MIVRIWWGNDRENLWAQVVHSSWEFTIDDVRQVLVCEFTRLVFLHSFYGRKFPGNPFSYKLGIYDAVVIVSQPPKAGLSIDGAALFLSFVSSHESPSFNRFARRALTPSMAIRFRAALLSFLFRAAAPCFAMSDRSTAFKLKARALPPSFPSATAAGFFFLLTMCNALYLLNAKEIKVNENI